MKSRGGARLRKVYFSAGTEPSFINPRPPEGQEPGPLRINGTIVDELRECASCFKPIEARYNRCFTCYAKLDRTAQSRDRLLWQRKGNSL